MLRSLFFQLLFCSIAFSGFSQLTSSSCTAPDSVVSLYQQDADRLTIKWIYENELPAQNEVEIPEELSNTFLDALIAVYNATDLAARDSVIEMFNIHTWHTPTVDILELNADGDLAWMNDLQNGIFPTGNSEVNSLLETYELEVLEYYDYVTLENHTVMFYSADNYNIEALGELFEEIEGVVSAGGTWFAGDGGDIQAMINEDHVELIYEHAWGDCPAGCIYSHFWKFRVYDDCSVEFVTSYGTPVSVGERVKNPISVYPNPLVDVLNLKGTSGEVSFLVIASDGRVVMEGKTNENQITGFQNLAPGQYLVTIFSEVRKSTFQVIKK